MKPKNSVPTEIPVEEVAAVEETPVVEEEVKPVVEEAPVVKDTPVNEKPVLKNGVGVVTAKILAVREEPSMDSTMIRVIYANTEVKYKKVNKDWVELLDSGFCMSKFIR